MNVATTNLFPLPYWAPALQRVPTPLLVLNEAFTKGERARKSLLSRVIDVGASPQLSPWAAARAASPLAENSRRR
jgi:hypothetical protein